MTSGLLDPDGLATDAAGGKMYWVDFVTDKVQRADLDGSNVESVVTDFEEGRPEGITLDVAA